MVFRRKNADAPQKVALYNFRDRRADFYQAQYPENEILAIGRILTCLGPASYGVDGQSGEMIAFADANSIAPMNLNEWRQSCVTQLSRKQLYEIGVRARQQNTDYFMRSTEDAARRPKIGKDKILAAIPLAIAISLLTVAFSITAFQSIFS